MNFTKQQQKPIATLVALAFFNLVFVTALPVSIEAKPAPAANASLSVDDSDGPLAIEKAGIAPVNSGKSALLPIIIGVVVAGAIAAVLILVVFKTKYDITGTWTVTETYSDEGSSNYTYVFTGDKASGTVNVNNGAWTGTYTVDGKNVIINLSGKYKLTGAFDTKTTMKGDIYCKQVKSGTFSAVKQ